MNDRLASLRRRPNAVFGLVILGVALVVLLARLSVPVERPPEGWSVIRPPAEVSALAVQGDVLWAGGRDGLVAVDRATSRVDPPPDGAPDLRYVKDLLVDADGGLWVAHAAGVSRYARGAWSGVPEADSLLSGAALSLWQDRDGAIWVGGEKGVARIGKDGARLFTEADGLAAPSVDVIFQDRDGVMWFGAAPATRGGLTSFDGARWRRYFTGDGLAHNSVNAIIQDRAGALWFATGFHDRGGASRLAGGVWTTLTRAEGLAGEKVRTVYEDRDGRLLFASEYDGVAVYDGQRWRVLTPSHGLADWEVKRIIQDPDGVYWLGTLDGITRFPGLE